VGEAIKKRGEHVEQRAAVIEDDRQRTENLARPRRAAGRLLVGLIYGIE
jgi:hypothetical protein